MTKTNAKSAIAAAKANKAPAPATDMTSQLAALLAKMSPEQIAELLGNKAPAKQEKAADADFSGLIGKLVEVTDGRKHVGKTFKCFYVTKGGFRKPSALCEGDELLTDGATPTFINPSYLKVIGDMDAKDIKRLKDMQEAQKSETLYIAATAVSETDKSIQLRYPTWAKNLWFSRPSMISIAGDAPDGSKIFEIAAWKVKKECGMDAYNALLAKQADLEKIVNS